MGTNDYSFQYYELTEQCYSYC